MMTTRFVLTFAAVFICGSAAQAQKRCTKGIPCGNTCIAANKTCHVGQGTATREAPPPARVSLRDTTVATPDSTLPWIAGRNGTTFYLNSATCPARSVILSLGRENVVYFKTESDAKKYGAVKSAAKDCS
jgi:hypothetical protein